MNTVDISLNGPVMESLCEVTIADQHATDTFTLDHADVSAAREEGHAELLELILDNCGGTGIDTLRAALANGSPVLLDGENVTTTVLRGALEGGSSPAP